MIQKPLSINKYKHDFWLHIYKTPNIGRCFICIFPPVICKNQCQYPKLNMRLCTWGWQVTEGNAKQGSALKLQVYFSLLLQGTWNSSRISEAGSRAQSKCPSCANILGCLALSQGPWAQPQETAGTTEGAQSQMGNPVSQTEGSNVKWQGCLPFPELKVYRCPALRNSNTFHRPFTEATEISDQSERANVAFGKTVILANITK